MNLIKISSEKTPLVYLQSITEQDATDEYVQWLNDPLINQYLETRFNLQNLSTVIDFIRKTIETPNEHLFTIRLKKNNKHVGNIKIGGISVHHNIGDVSLFIGDKSVWGKGIARQAIQLISRFSLEYLKLRKLSASAYKPNIASTKAFIRSGYVHDSVLRDHFIFKGQPCDLVSVCFFEQQLAQLPEIILLT